MDGQTKFNLIAVLKRELHADECTDERSLAIMAEIRKIESISKPEPVKRAKQPKQAEDRYLTVLGGYVLDTQNHGRLVGTRNEAGQVIGRDGKLIE